MTTKNFLITGLARTVSEDGLRSWLGRFGPIARVEIFREGNPDEPVAVVEMMIGDGAAAYLLSHLTEHWHDGKLVNARLLHH